MAAPLAGRAGAVLRDLALRSARLRGEFPAPPSARPDEAADSWGGFSQQPLVLTEDFIPSRFCWSDSTAGNT